MFIDSPLSVGGGVLPKEAEVRGSSVFCNDICKEFLSWVARSSWVGQRFEIAKQRPTDFLREFKHGARAVPRIPKKEKPPVGVFDTRRHFRHLLSVNNFECIPVETFVK